MSRRRAASSVAEGAANSGKKGKKGGNQDEAEDEAMVATYKVTPTAAASALPLVVKATLSCMQANRDYESILVDVGLVAKDSNLVKKMKQATTEWNEQVKRDGKSHQHGPPHLRAWAALLLALTEEDVGAANKQLIQKAHASFQEMTSEEKGLNVRMCRMKKCYDKNLMKLQFAVRGSLEALRGTVRGALAQCKVDMKSGRAPATALERKLQDLLEEWQL